MVDEKIVHPAEASLMAYIECRLPAEDVERIDRHIDTCDTCCQFLETHLDPAEIPHLAEVLAERRARASVGRTITLAEETRPIEPDGIDVAREFSDSGYDIHECLGQGGMGMVFRASQLSVGRHVAVKVIRPSPDRTPVTEERARRRFQQEIRTLAKLEHPNIVRVYDAGSAGRLAFVAMELIQGTTVTRMVAEARRNGQLLPIETAIRYTIDAARGLGAAHNLGIVHRDVKPDNMMADRSGVIKILDLGLARSVQQFHAPESADGQLPNIRIDPTPAVATQGLHGTPAYMSPEQFRGAQVDSRADLYSLGCTLFYMLTGRTVFACYSTRKYLEAHLAQAPPRIRCIRSDVPQSLESLIDRLLSKNPADRPATAEELIADLEAILAEWTTATSEAMETAPPAGPAIRTERRVRRILRSVVAIGTAVTAILLVFSLIRVTTPTGVLEIETDDPDVEVVVRQGGKVVKILDGKSGRTVTLTDGKYELELGGKAEGLLLDADRFVLSRENRTEIVRVKRVPADVKTTDGKPRELSGHQGQVWGVAVSNDGLRIASAGEDGTVRIWERATGRLLTTLRDHKKVVKHIAFATHGDRWISSGQDPVTLARQGADGKTVGELVGHGDIVRKVVLNSEGTEALTCSYDRTIRRWDLRSGKELGRLTGHTDVIHALAWAPGLDRVVSGGFDRSVRFWSLRDSKPLAEFRLHQGSVVSTAVSPDGRFAASSSDDRQIWLFDLKTLRPLRFLTGHAGTVMDIAFTADSRGLISVSEDGSLRFWDLQTSRAVKIEIAPARLTSVAITPDGKNVIAGAYDGIVRIWNMPDLTTILRSGRLDPTIVDYQAGKLRDPLVGWESRVDCDFRKGPDGAQIQKVDHMRAEFTDGELIYSATRPAGWYCDVHPNLRQQQVNDLIYEVECRITGHPETALILRTGKRPVWTDFRIFGTGEFSLRKGDSATYYVKRTGLPLDIDVREWNRFRMEIVGDRARLFVNGKCIADQQVDAHGPGVAELLVENFYVPASVRIRELKYWISTTPK